MKIKSLIFFIPSILLCGNMAIVDISNQQIIVQDEYGNILLEEAVSTGNKFHPTPKGAFRVIDKQKHHKSNLYPIRDDGSRGGAVMDYMLKFTHGGNAIHKGRVVYEGEKSIPVSHGCIRLAPIDAKRVFSLLQIGDRIKVVGKYNYKDNFNSRLKKEKRGDILYLSDYSDDGYYKKEFKGTLLNITYNNE